MKDLTNKSVAELVAMLAEAQRDDALCVEEIGAAMSEHDLSARAIDRNVRLQAKSHLLWVRMQTIEHALKAARLREWEAEVVSLRADIGRLEREHAACLEEVFAEAYPLLQFRPEAAHEWHERRRHEVRALVRDSHKPVEIAGRIQDARARLEAIEAALAKIDATERAEARA